MSLADQKDLEGEEEDVVEDLAMDIVSPTLIVPSLFCGGVDAIQDDAFTKDTSITHVMSVGTEAPAAGLFAGEKALHLNIPNGGDLLPHLQHAVRFIHSARVANGKALVHCSQGLSSSPAVVAAYLMASLDISASEAVGHVRAGRPSISIDDHHINELKTFETEKMGKQDALAVLALLDGLEVGKWREIDRMHLEGEQEAWLDDWSSARLRTLTAFSKEQAQQDQSMIRVVSGRQADRVVSGRQAEPWDVPGRGRAMSTLVVGADGKKDIPLPDWYSLPPPPTPAPV